MNPDLEKLHPYPFEKLQKLFSGTTANPDLKTISLSIGEPKHEAPQFVQQIMAEELGRLANYPATKGLPELRQAIVRWLTSRFQLPSDSLDAEHHVLPVNGTREALFAFAQATIDRRQNPLVLFPNPFYQIYEGATLLAGAEPYYLNCDAENGFIPDYDAVPESVWQRCQLLFLCSPGNPTGAVADRETLKKLIDLAHQYDFVIASDECYSEIYFDEQQPPVGLLQVCAEQGNTDYSRCTVFHSLSKRSNLPGLRSGFIAGDASIIKPFLRYRTYHGCAMPTYSQLASIAAWSDENHVRENREQYREKFAAVLGILSPLLKMQKPDAGFYLWPETPIGDDAFAQQLYASQNVIVLPGRYLSRTTPQGNPGESRVRMALVATVEECVEAANRIKHFLE